MEQAAAVVGSTVIAPAAAVATSASCCERRPEEPELQQEDDEEEQLVYCAVGVGIARAGGGGNGNRKETMAKHKRKQQEWKANLQWVLANVAAASNSKRRRQRIVLVHLRRLPSRINMMGAWVPVSQVADEEVAACRQLEEERITKVLDDLLDICKSQKVNASKIIIACDDIAKGLVQFVDDHGVTELVMGAASDRAYTRKIRAPRSKKALTVQRKANPSCKIWFVCNGNLICTREASEGPHRAESSTSSTSPRSSTSDYSRSKSSPCFHSETFSTQESDDPSVEQTPTREYNAMNRSMENLNRQATAVAGSSTGLVSEIAEAEVEPAGVQLLQEIEEDQETSTSDGLSDDEQFIPFGQDAGEMDDGLYEKLKVALMEAENLRHEAYEETRRRQMAERELAEASKMADEAESSYQREAKHRKEMEEMLARERAAMEQDRQELNDILEKIQKVDDRSAELELQITSSERMMIDLEARLSESYSLLDTLRREHQQQQGQGDPAKESEAQDDDGGQEQQEAVSFSRLGYSELDEATNHFDESVRIDGGGGGGGRGKVYRAELRSMAVAVKVLDRDAAVDEARFTRAVEGVIRRARHPNLVTLVGACPEARALAYELVPGGSLEEHLATAALPWHARCGIAYGACSALAFLHSTATAHGDVRPATILLDAGRGRASCKLAGLGTRALVARGAAVARPALAYADPRYVATGELSPRCDVYSLGVVLLRLVTGRPAFLTRKAAQEAVAASGGGAAWQEVAGAGGWPAERAREVALLGLKCCDVNRGPWSPSPGELLEEARGVLEAAVSAAPGRSPSSLSDGAPSYFLCPILKEVMRDPQIAGDGSSYEAEAIREWLGSGHDTSPMTNLKLPTQKLMPNHALRSAIYEWRHRPNGSA
ncbi:hypothetical protein U9M48_021436 [Paspalum notatum var. saurae]|uniref:RING-type E3 ubiquitin transferase n=1 Tax=Paspalum notatum var. saurae TaxID=547442 RepID=A0AAQ3TGB5_PASNO